MVTLIIFIIWLCLILFFIFWADRINGFFPLIIWLLGAITWIIPIFTGAHFQSNSGEYKGYVISVEQNGVLFKGWNAYLKSDLASSNEETACIDGKNQQLIDELRGAMKEQKLVTLSYEGVWQFAIGECPGTDWMIIDVQ